VAVRDLTVRNAIEDRLWVRIYIFIYSYLLFIFFSIEFFEGVSRGGPYRWSMDRSVWWSVDPVRWTDPRTGGQCFRVTSLATSIIDGGVLSIDCVCGKHHTGILTKQIKTNRRKIGWKLPVLVLKYALFHFKLLASLRDHCLKRILSFPFTCGVHGKINRLFSSSASQLSFPPSSQTSMIRNSEINPKL